MFVNSIAGRLLVLAVLVAAVPARADNIDEELLRQTNQGIMKDLRSHNYQNVGVLKFRVQRGDHASGYSVGLLNANMAARLETALILANNEKAPIGITRNASQALAAKDPRLTASNARDRAALFTHKFPLAWGKEQVKVDAFLTGLVKIDPKKRRTTVVVEAFDSQSPDLREVANFTVATDRSILSDSGESFSLAMRDVKVRRRGEELEEDAARFTEDRETGKRPANDPDVVENLVDLEVFYDGQKAPIGEDRGEKRVAEPREGQKVTFGLRNKSGERLAVVVRVNGVNTLGKEGPEKQIDQYTRWVLEPKKVYTIEGFYSDDGKSVEKFKVVSPRSLSDLDPDKLGLIELDVFRSAGEADPAAQERKLSLRGLGKKEPEAKDLAELKKKIMRAAAAPAGKRNVIVGGDAENANVEETPFKNPVHTGAVAIRYFAP